MTQPSPDMQPPELDPTGRKTPVVTPMAGATPKPRAILHKAPTPPSLIRRLVLLVIRPEQWAEAARYPLRATVRPLVILAALMALAVGISNAAREYAAFGRYAQTYDQSHPALLYANGKLSLDPAAGKDKALPRIEDPARFLAVDLAGKTRLDDVNQPLAVLVSADKLTVRTFVWQREFSWTELADNATGPVRIDGAFLASALKSRSADLIAFMALFGTLSGGAGFVQAFILALAGAFLMAFLLMPVVALGAPKLVMPRAVAFRISLATMVPLVAFAGLLETINCSPTSALPPAVVPCFYMFSATALALWAGYLANAMFSARRQRRSM